MSGPHRHCRPFGQVLSGTGVPGPGRIIAITGVARWHRDSSSWGGSWILGWFQRAFWLLTRWLQGGLRGLRGGGLRGHFLGTLSGHWHHRL